MSDIIISAEGLGKEYRIRHKAVEPYTTLRDVIADKVRNAILPNWSGAERLPIIEDFWALRDASFAVRRGEVMGIIGRNGAGKSTLLKILSRITEPSEGRVEIDGRVASLLEVGTGFHPELTGRENIYLNGAILGMSRAETKGKFDEIVAFAGVERFLDTPVKRYSSGMYVRLAFAVAAHLEQEILIVDEVLAVGDAEFQKKCLGKMEQVARGGRTILYVSHNIMSVQALCDSCIFLDQGRLRLLGPVEDVIKAYSSENARGANTTINLGSALSLTRLEIHPKAIYCGDPLRIQVQLMPKKRGVLKELAVLLYSIYGIRVAVLDLRRHDVCELVLGKGSIDFEIKIESLPLIDGEYRVGFYVVTDDYRDDFLDLASFVVNTTISQNEIIPYPAQHRGLVNLSFSVAKPAISVAEVQY